MSFRPSCSWLLPSTSLWTTGASPCRRIYRTACFPSAWLALGATPYALPRGAALGQLGLTVKHEVNNALTAIVAESEFVMGERQEFAPEQKTSVETIRESAMRIVRDTGKITSLETAPVTAVAGGAEMVDLDAATYRRR